MRKIVLFAIMVLLSSPLWAQRVMQQEMLIFPHQDEHVHGSSLVNLPNGDMLAAWFQGSGERTADDVRIMGARLKKGTTTWSKPFLLADTPHIPDCNPVLFLNAKGKLFLVWIAVQANLWEQSILRVRTSVKFDNDGPPVWNWQDNILLKPDAKFAGEVVEKLEELPENQNGWAGYAPRYDEMITGASKDAAKRSIGWMTRIKPLVEPDGRILLPLYSDGFNMSMLAISEDHGESWRPSLPIVGRGPIQPALVRKKDGKLVAFMRDSGDSPTEVHRSESSDKGETWTATVKTGIPNTASVEALNLQDGKWAFLGNDITDGRYQLSLMLSDDDGASWKWKFFLENDPTKKGSFSYPCMIQTADGMLRITYSHHPEKGRKSIKYVVVDPAKIPKTISAN